MRGGDVREALGGDGELGWEAREPEEGAEPGAGLQEGAVAAEHGQKRGVGGQESAERALSDEGVEGAVGGAEVGREGGLLGLRGGCGSGGGGAAVRGAPARQRERRGGEAAVQRAGGRGRVSCAREPAWKGGGGSGEAGRRGGVKEGRRRGRGRWEGGRARPSAVSGEWPRIMWGDCSGGSGGGAPGTSSASLANSGRPSSARVPSSTSLAISRLRKVAGSASSLSGRSSRSTPSASASAGCGNMEGLRSAMAEYETHSSAT